MSLRILEMIAISLKISLDECNPGLPDRMPINQRVARRTCTLSELELFRYRISSFSKRRKAATKISSHYLMNVVFTCPNA